MALVGEQLLEVHRIVERRGGATYRTEYVEDRWVPVGTPLGLVPNEPDLMYSPKSTTYTGRTIRTRRTEG